MDEQTPRESPIACDLTAMDTEQRARYQHEMGEAAHYENGTP